MAKFIKTSCNQTLYPEVCVSSLSSYAGSLRPKQSDLTMAAVTVSLVNALDLQNSTSGGRIPQTLSDLANLHTLNNDTIEPTEATVGQADTVSTAENQPIIEDPPTSKFTWTIEQLSKLNVKKHYSETFVVGGYKWRILIFPRGNNVDHLSMYLDVADSSTLPYGWSRYAHFSLVVANQIHSKYSVRKDTQHQFNARESDWGFTSFIPLLDLYDSGKGYLVNDTLVIEAEVTVQRGMDNFQYDSKKETGFVGLKNQGATCYMNSLLQTLYHMPYFRKRFISGFLVLHEARSQRYIASELKVAEHLGLALGVLRCAKSNFQGRLPGEDYWRQIFRQEIDALDQMLRKCEHENEFIWHDKLPSLDELPVWKNCSINSIYAIWIGQRIPFHNVTLGGVGVVILCCPDCFNYFNKSSWCWYS